MKNETVRDRLAGLEHQVDTLKRQLLEIREQQQNSRTHTFTGSPGGEYEALNARIRHLTEQRSATASALDRATVARLQAERELAEVLKQNQTLQDLLTGADDVLAQVAAERDRLRDELARQTKAYKVLASISKNNLK